MKNKFAPSLEIASRVLTAVDAGLVSGLGNQIPGQMCVEAAVCFAFGLPHGDEPPCVGSAVRSFKIALNDSGWSSNSVRATGMRRLAIAQLGSDILDQAEFSRLLALRATQRMLPDALRDYAQYCYPKYVEKLKSIADDCEKAQNNKDVLASLASLAKFLMSVAVLGEQVLVEMGSPGCAWLYLCDGKSEGKSL